MSRPKKSAPKEPCGHWVISFDLRQCGDCGKAVILTVNASEQAQADRNAHNEAVIAKMRTAGYIGDMDEDAQ